MYDSRENEQQTKQKSKARKREVTTSGFILVVSTYIDAAFWKRRSHREEPSLSGGSDEPSLQLLFIMINFCNLDN